MATDKWILESLAEEMDEAAEYDALEFGPPLPGDRDKAGLPALPSTEHPADAYIEAYEKVAFDGAMEATVEGLAKRYPNWPVTPSSTITLTQSEPLAALVIRPVEWRERPISEDAYLHRLQRKGIDRPAILVSGLGPEGKRRARKGALDIKVFGLRGDVLASVSAGCDGALPVGDIAVVALVRLRTGPVKEATVEIGNVPMAEPVGPSSPQGITAGIPKRVLKSAKEGALETFLDERDRKQAFAPSARTWIERKRYIRPKPPAHEKWSWWGSERTLKYGRGD